MRLIFFSLLLFLFACGDKNQSSETPSQNSTSLSQFTGDDAVVKKAEDMFQALGGKDRWAKLKSLYVKATHNEPDLPNPYTNEVWRDIEWFKIRIEQDGPDLQRIGTFNDHGGAINFLDQDNIRELSGMALDGWRKSHAQNIYVILNRLAKEGIYEVKEEGGRIKFLKDSNLFCAFQLNQDNLPEMFIVERRKGQEVISQFTKWGTSEGFTHPTSGGPIDGNFVFNTIEWKPQFKNFDEAFDVSHTQE